MATTKNMYLLRQFIVIVGLALGSVADGFIYGQMSGMVDALQSGDSDIVLTDGDVSWIAASMNITCITGFAVVAIVTELLGRRRTITILNIPILICWILVYTAQDKITLIISRIIVGVCYGGALLLIIVSTGEYISPSMRAVCLNMISSVGSSVGVTLGHVFSTVLHWRTVALIGIIPTALSGLLPCFWVESPSWLASKGRFEECIEAFKTIRTPTESSDKELQLLLKVESSKYDKARAEARSVMFSKVLTGFKQKYFWKIVLLSCTISVYLVSAGKIMFNTYNITILQDITGTSDILLFTLLVDGFFILGSLMSCFLVNKYKLRPLLFTTGLISNTILLIFSFSLYTLPTGYAYSAWIKTCLMAMYFVTVSAGPYAVLDTLMSEIYPLEIKAYCIFIFGSVAGIMTFSSIKLAGKMFVLMGYHGVFFLNSMLVYACLAILWFRMPETKGRTLQEIEYYFKNDKYENVRDLINCEQVNASRRLLES